MWRLRWLYLNVWRPRWQQWWRRPLAASSPRASAIHHGIGASAAALGAAELQILDRLVPLPRVDDRLKVGRAPAEAACSARPPQA